MKYKQLYKETGNIYSVSAELRKRKREKRSKILLRVLSVTAVAAITFGLHIYSVWKNGREGIGGEVMVPVIAFLGYVVYKGMKNDERKRKEHREWLTEELRKYDSEEKCV